MRYETSQVDWWEKYVKTLELSQELGVNRVKEAHLDISATSFWIPGQKILDERVFDLNAQRYRDQDLSKCFKRNEDEKKEK